MNARAHSPQCTRAFRMHARANEVGAPDCQEVPFEPSDLGTPFAERRLVQAFAELPPVAGDSTRFIAEDRDRR